MRAAFVSAVAVALLASGCVTPSIKRDQVGAVRRVALVAYQGSMDFEDKWNPENQDNVVAGTVGLVNRIKDMASGNRYQRRQEQAGLAYDALARKLGEAFAWEVVDPRALTDAPTYKARLTKFGGIMHGDEQYLEGVLVPAETNMLSAAERAAIAHELGVDALLVTDVRFTPGRRGGFAIEGMGSTTVYPMACASFVVFDAGGEVIWNDPWACGEAASEPLRRTMGAELVGNETFVLTEAATSAFDAVLTRQLTAAARR